MTLDELTEADTADVSSAVPALGCSLLLWFPHLSWVR